MSTWIEAYIPDTDPIYQRQKKIFLACQEADVSLPQETAEYFGFNHPDTGEPEEKLRVALTDGSEYIKGTNDMQEYIEVDLTKLPKGVTKLRFINSW